MEAIIIRTLQLILCLSLLVVIHEFGHFIFARIFKTRVEKFYMFFNPKFSLFKYKYFNSKWHFRFFSKNNIENDEWKNYPDNTEWGIGWLPLGGYCKIAGMVDESMDTESLTQPVQDWEFRSKPAYQRFFIMIGGVLFNFISAILIYSGMLLHWGEEYIPLENMTMGMEFSEVAHNYGFKDGDILIAADDEKLIRFDENSIRKLLNAHNATVRRNGKDTTFVLSKNFAQDLIAENQGFAEILYPTIVDSIFVGSLAVQAQLTRGDQIVKINDIETKSFADFYQTMSTMKDSSFVLGIYRDNKYIELNAHCDENSKLGFVVLSPRDLFESVRIDYNLISCIPAGCRSGFNTLKGYVSDFKYVFSKEGVKQMGSFGTIGSMFAPTWNWYIFWYMTALLAVILAFMNILPIPALDGGHILFLLYEIIFRRKPSEKVLYYAQLAGMTLLMLLFALAISNDINRLF